MMKRTVRVKREDCQAKAVNPLVVICGFTAFVPEVRTRVALGRVLPYGAENERVTGPFRPEGWSASSEEKPAKGRSV